MQIWFRKCNWKFGYGEENDNSSRMLSMCASHGLSVMGSWFQRKNIHRLSWISNDGRTLKELDHILTSDRSMFNSYRVFRGAEAPALTDHRLVCAEITLRHSQACAKADLESWYSDIATEVEAGISKNI